MRITNAHKDAYVLCLMGWSHLQIADQLQRDFDEVFTTPQIKRMIREVRRVVRLQQRAASDAKENSG